LRLINPAFQWKYTVWVVLGVFFACMIMSAVLFGVLHQQARARVLNPAAVHVWENTLVLVFAAVAFAALLSVALGLWGFVMTHRLCGPLYVVEGYLRELAAGRFPKHRPLRKKDEFKDFYDEFWRAVDAIRARERSNLATVTEALNLLHSACAAGGESDKDVLEPLMTQIEVLRTEIATALGEEHDVRPTEAPANLGST